MKKHLLLCLVLSLCMLVAFSQQKVRDGSVTGTNLPNKDAIIELESSNKGLLHVRVALKATTNSFPLTAHVAGMMVYNTATDGDVTPGIYYNDGTKWVKGGKGDPGAQGPMGLTGATGATGPQGIQGVKGDTGAQGPIGLTGATGNQGIQGEKGELGASGAKGDTGATGAQGPVGATGANGAQGLPGTSGIDGAKGDKGDTGAIGPQGPIGLTGSVGANGTNGLNGAPGTQGEKGDKGDTGAVGPQGPIGLTGSVGANGTNGLNGTPGPQGTQGEKGDTGAVGPQGPIGLTGATGANGAQGIQGEKGDKGDAGEPGQNGAAGTPGVNGVNGLQGAPGPKGDKGDTGSVGPQGPAGPQGNTGNTGNNGSNGQDGRDGAQGPVGPQGATGPAGIGQIGPTGPQGPQGVTGPAGPKGDTGTFTATADNGLTLTTNNIQLGGPLVQPTTITTTTSNTLAITGLLNGAGTENLVVTDPITGVLKSVPLNTLNNDWHITGNIGTNATANFLGTTDAVPLRFKVNNQFAGYIGLSAYPSGGGQDLNTTFGYRAGGDVVGRMLASTDFRKNTAIGYEAMANGIIGAGDHTTENTAIGYAAGSSLGGASTRNTFVGGTAGVSMIGGSRNTAIGQGALFTSTGGEFNVALGWSAGANVPLVGNYNTFLGTLSGFNGSGSNNILVGYSAGYNYTGSNRLMIDNSGTNTPIIDGDLAGRVLTINNTLKVADLALGAATTSGNRMVVAGADGQLRIGTASVITTADNGLTKTADNIQLGGLLTGPTTITTDATKTLSLAGLQNSVTPTTDVVLVADANGVLKTIPKSFFAVDLRLLDDGHWNHITQDAGLLGNGTSVGDGQANIAIGKNAMLVSSFGDVNTAIGYETLKSAESGTGNTSLGAYTLLNLTSGNNNTAIGISSLQALASGTANVGLGNFSGSGLTAGNNNTFLGTNTVAANAITNATAIGANASVTASNSMVLGNGVNVGIGVSNPSNTLHVKAAAVGTDPVKIEGLQASTTTLDKTVVMDANGVLKTGVNKLVTVTSAYTVGVNDNTIIITGGAINTSNIIMPQASLSNGRTLYIVNYSPGGAQTLYSYNGVAAELVTSVTTVAGVASYEMLSAQTGDFYGKATFQCDGNKWYMVAGATN